ncbi:MAG: hypothetical protein R3B09_35915 [Nannocystaceae bacterium]
MRLTVPAIVAIFGALLALRIFGAPALGIAAPMQRGIEAFAGLGALLAALAFDRGDPPRRPWTLLAIGMLMVPFARACSHFDVHLGGLKVTYLLLILSNVLSVGALVFFHRVLLSTGLTPEWTPSGRFRARLLVVVVLALAIALTVVQLSGLHVATMDLGAWVKASVTTISTLADAALFAGGLLLVRLVAPMVGGSVALPYVLVAVGGACSLVVDLFSVLLDVTTQDQFEALLPIVIATVGWTAFGLAGVSQRMLVRSGN